MKRFAAAVALIVLAAGLRAPAQETVDPHLSYIYPAGGQRGTVVRVLAGGQRFNGVAAVLVTGEGVHATVVRSLGRLILLNGQERSEVIRRLNEMRAKRKDPKGNPGEPSKRELELPDHPLLNNLDSLSPLEEDFLVSEFLMRDSKRQLNQQLSETVLIEVTIDPGAVAGERELRLKAQMGLTNPLVFQVGGAVETLELQASPAGTPAPAVDLPAALNGQIRPGDADRFRFRAREGQSLVIRAQARRLVPFVADAVPGWFQATLALYDARGREVEFEDDNRFDPDPVLFFKAPQAGEYELEIRDALYRGREDFVYRILISEQPFVTDIFPLGGKAGEETIVTARGWNVSQEKLPLDTGADGGALRQTVLHSGDWTSNEISYAVDTLPECLDVEPNNTPEEAQLIELPVIVNGRIGVPGDEDVFRFQGRIGAELVVEVQARRLNSPLDSVVWLTDPAGRVVAWNDDVEHLEGTLRTDIGLSTHHADSYLRAKLTQDGIYRVRLADSQRHGGEPYAYRLRLSAPRPDFLLAVTPSAINIRGGIAMPVTVHVIRLDGFEGPIVLSLQDPPPGYLLQGAVIPAGRDSVRMTLTPPLKDPGEPVALHIQGLSRVGTRLAFRPAIPCDECMQAFLWRHLVPAQELLVTIVNGAGRLPPPEVQGKLPVRIPRGGSVEVLIHTAARLRADDIFMELDDPPPGITLVKSTPTKDGLKLELKAAPDTPAASFEGNLIVQASVEWGGKETEGKKSQKRRIAFGVLPAIPYKVIVSGR